MQADCVVDGAAFDLSRNSAAACGVICSRRSGAASGLGARIVGKINELIEMLTRDRKADLAWKEEAERRFADLEGEAAYLRTRNHGLKVAKGKATASQARVEAKLEEARRLLN